MPRKSLDASQIAKIIRLYEQGYNIDKVALLTKHSPWTVHKYLKQAGIVRPKYHRNEPHDPQRDMDEFAERNSVRPATILGGRYYLSRKALKLYRAKKFL